MNPYYLAYCTAQGRTPDAQRAHDVTAWPGGRMCGFILWMSAAYRAWAEELGIRAQGGYRAHEIALMREGPEAFGRWLEAYAQRTAPAPAPV